MLSPCLPFKKARQAARFSFHVERVRDVRLHRKWQSFVLKSKNVIKRVVSPRRGEAEATHAKKAKKRT